jgi:hypothetical protein
MPQKRRYTPPKRPGGRSQPAELRSLHRPPPLTERPPAIVYGKPFIVLEDHAKNTFIYKAGAWVPHSESIAQCRETCQVKELPQRVNQMVRYEVRCPE